MAAIVVTGVRKGLVFVDALQKSERPLIRASASLSHTHFVIRDMDFSAIATPSSLS